MVEPPERVLVVGGVVVDAVQRRVVQQLVVDIGQIEAGPQRQVDAVVLVGEIKGDRAVACRL